VKKRPFIFLIMPLTPRSTDNNHAVEYLGNVRKGIDYATFFIKHGFSVYCPAIDYSYFLFSDSPSLTTQEIYEQDLCVIPHCDAVFILPGSEKSPNCAREYAMEVDNGLRNFKDIYEIMEWKDANF